MHELEVWAPELAGRPVPTVFFGQARVVGAVPLQEYLQVLEKFGVR